MELKDRIELVMQQENLTAKDLADKLGVQRSSISHLMNGRNKPSHDFLEKFIEQFPSYNIAWLITGQGNIMNNTGVVTNVSNNQKTPKKIIQYSLFDDEDFGLASKTCSYPQEQIDNSANVEANSGVVDKCKYDAKQDKVDAEKIIIKVMFFYSDGTYDSFVENKKY